MVAGVIVGGAIMDGITTGAESAIKDECTPSGSIKAWTEVVKGTRNGDGQQVVGGVVGGLVTPVIDGIVGYSACSYVQSRNVGTTEASESSIETSAETVEIRPDRPITERPYLSLALIFL